MLQKLTLAPFRREIGLLGYLLIVTWLLWLAPFQLLKLESI